MNELEQIRTFVQLVDAGSSTKAAELRGLAVSAISRRMKELENRLGVQLLQRTTRKMHLTDAGRVFYERCVQLLADLADAEAEVTESNAVLRGRLRVAVPLSLGIAHLVPAIVEFMNCHPELRIELDMSDRQVDLVEEGFELAIRVGRLRDSSLMARKIGDFRHVVCASPDFLSVCGEPEHPADMRGWPALCYSHLSRPSSWHFDSGTGDSGSVDVEARMLSTNGDALREAAIAGLGVICEPSFIVHDAVERGLLKVVLQQYRWHDMAIYAVYPPTRHLSTKVRRFIDFLARRFGDEPYWEAFLR